MKKSISVSNLTLSLYLDYVRPAAIRAGLLEAAVTEGGKPYHITDEAIAWEIESCMRSACFNAGYDGVERTLEEYTAHEAEEMLYQFEVSLKYCKDEKVLDAVRSLRDEMVAEIERFKAEKTVKAIAEKVEQKKTRSAWDKGVKDYAVDLVAQLSEAVADRYIKKLDTRSDLRAALLNGAEDWKAYSWGGSALIYDGDIAKALCTASELKRTDNGNRRPNSREAWLDVQARALSQASAMILEASGLPAAKQGA